MDQKFTIKQAILLFLLAGCWTIGLVSAMYYYRIRVPFSPEILIHGGIILLILLFIHYVKPTKTSFQFTDTKFSRSTISLIIISLLSGLALWLLDYANSVFILHDDIEQQAHDLLKLANKDGFISTSLSICILAPLAEEMLFRGILLPAFAYKNNQRVGIIISSMLFSLIHFSPEHAIILFVAGICFGILRVTSRSIWPPFLAHCTNNTLTWSIYIIGWDSMVLI